MGRMRMLGMSTAHASLHVCLLQNHVWWWWGVPSVLMPHGLRVQGVDRLLRGRVTRLGALRAGSWGE